MDDKAIELQNLRREVHVLRERCRVLEAALARAQGISTDLEGLSVVAVGEIPIDGAALMVVDPMYVEKSWVHSSDASAVAVSLGPGEWARALAEPLEKAGHTVEWVNPIQLRVTPREGVTIEELADEARELNGPDGPYGRVGLVRPDATLERMGSEWAPRLVRVAERLVGNPEAAVFVTGGDGTATVLAFVDGDGFTRRIEIEFMRSCGGPVSLRASRSRAGGRG